MPEVKELMEKIETTWEQMKAKNDEVLGEAKGAVKKIEDYRAEDRQTFEKMNTALDEQKKQMDGLAVKLERRDVLKPGDGNPADIERDNAYKNAFFKWIRGGSKAMGADDWKALKNALSPERKSLVENTAGLYLVPEDVETEIIRAIPQVNQLRNYCRIRPTGRDKVRRRSLTEVSVGWGKLETGTDITESSQTPSQDYLYVEDLYGLSKIGEDELDDTDANLAAILSDSFSVAIANEETKRFAIGRGHTTYQEPAGIAVDATLIASYKVNWTTADTADTANMIKLPYKVKAQYRNPKSDCVFLMNSETELAIRLLRGDGGGGSGTGQYLWQPSLQVGQPNSFDGYAIVNQDDMNYPSDATAGINVVFGNFKLGYTILDRKGIAIQRLDELYAESGLVGFKVHRRVGGGVIRNAAFYGIYNNT